MNPFKREKKQVSLFVTAGYPERDALLTLLPDLQRRGVDFIEIGMPFSDPMADGPVIQTSSRIALQNGMTPALLFEQLHRLRAQITVPLVLMGYLNPVLQFGMEAFLKACSCLQIAGIIVPDLPLEYFRKHYRQLFAQYGVSPVFLVTPTTENERIREIATECRNSFVYLVGQNSITGAAYTIAEQQLDRYAEIRSLCAPTPVMLGFGIDSAAQKQLGFQSCDGVIVGSAYLRTLENGTTADFLNALLYHDTGQTQP